MKRTLILFLLFVFFVSNSQERKKFTIRYINMTSFSIAKNTESYFSNFSKDSIRSPKGFGFDLNSIHGVRFFGIIAISAGIGIDWNVDKTFLSTPYIIDVRLFSNKSIDNCLFLYLQTGKNIKWSNSFDGNGTSSKIGLGGIFSYDDDISLFVDVFRKSKQIQMSSKLDSDITTSQDLEYLSE